MKSWAEKWGRELAKGGNFGRKMLRICISGEKKSISGRDRWQRPVSFQFFARLSLIADNPPISFADTCVNLNLSKNVTSNGKTSRNCICHTYTSWGGRHNAITKSVSQLCKKESGCSGKHTNRQRWQQFVERRFNEGLLFNFLACHMTKRWREF